MKLLILSFLSLLGTFFCNHSLAQEHPSKGNYDFNKPQQLLILPDTLREISGLVMIDSTTVACIQDENGIVFFYDLVKNKIKRQFTFATNGDYEGIALVDQTLYILRSDGVLFEVNHFNSSKPQTKQYLTGIPAMNNEGLCYDKEHHRLLIGCKGKINKDTYYKDKRFIYEFDLTTKKLNQKPLFVFNVATANQYAKEHHLKLKSHTTKNGKVAEHGFKVNTSEIALHPINKQLYMLSASDHCLLIFKADGSLQSIEQFDPLLFNKAEGIAFFKNGDVLISNEAQNKKPTLLRFNFKN